MILQGLTLGEMIEWDRNIYPSILPGMIEKFGEGPFRVVALRELRRRDLSTPPYMVTVQIPSGDWQEFAGDWFQRK